ncbi:MAG: NDP-sugar synthase [Elusimicrobia bacterium]|nr:NDP-sugar synthase [Elusimicrobiota bacterium]
MRALILTGGLGTRLRPLTANLPKPVLPVVNRPFLEHQIGDLRRQGVREVLLATGYKPEAFGRALGDGRRLGVKLRCVHETKPLGTGGAVRNAIDFFKGTTLVLNGDVLQHLDLGAFLKRHRSLKAEATICLTRVADPTQFGLVELEPSGLVRRFLEKPSPEEVTCDTINAGAYLFEPSVVRLIPPGVAYSLERGLFPELLKRKRRMAAWVSRGYWLDIGTVEKYLQAHLDGLGGEWPLPLKGLRRRGSFLLGSGATLGAGAAHEGPGRVVLGAGAKVAAARFSGSVCLGPRTRVDAGAALTDCVVLERSHVGKDARLERCVVGRDCRVGAGALVGPGRALGDGSILTAFSR